MDDDERKRFEHYLNERLAETLSRNSGVGVDHPDEFYQLTERRIAVLRRRCWVCRTDGAYQAHLIRVARWMTAFCLRNAEHPRKTMWVAIAVSLWFWIVVVFVWLTRKMPCVVGCESKLPEKGEDEMED